MENIAKHPEITVYAVNWCSDCWRAKRFLNAHGIEHTWVDIERNPEARGYVERVNHGMRSVPTIVFADGSLLVEPTGDELVAKLGTESEWRG